MTAGQFDFDIEQGATFHMILTCYDENHALIDFTNFTAVMKARAALNSDVVYLSLANGSGITLGGVAGTLDVLIDKSVTAAYTFSTAVYDITITDGSGVATRVFEGTITLSRQASR